MPSTSIATTSPEERNLGGCIPIPTPLGVPVAIMSPGISVMPAEIDAMSVGISKISSVRLAS